MEKLDLNILKNVTGGTKIPYIVKAGDTLGELSKRFHVSIEDICRWNQITDPNIINEGQMLIFKF